MILFEGLQYMYFMPDSKLSWILQMWFIRFASVLSSQRLLTNHLNLQYVLYMYLFIKTINLNQQYKLYNQLLILNKYGTVLFLPVDTLNNN